MAILMQAAGNDQKQKFDKKAAFKLGLKVGFRVAKLGLEIAGIPCPDCDF